MLRKNQILMVLLSLFIVLGFVSSSLVEAKTKEEVYQEKLAQVKEGDIRGYFDLGLWCQQNKLDAQAKEMFEKVIVLDPEHTGAREKLDYIKYKNKWIKKGEETKVDYEEKLAKLKDDDVEGHYGLGCWCKEKKLLYEARDEFENVVKLDLNHQKAQKELELITQQLSPTGFFKRPMDKYKSHYCVNVPKQYDSKKKWPLIIGLHGTGGTGDMFLRRRWEQISNEKGHLVIAPKSIGNNWDMKDEDFVMTCLDDFKKDYQIDTSRVYLTGFTGGASMTLLFGMNNFQKFTALAMVGGGGQAGPISPNTVVLPLYFLVGEKDQSTKDVIKPVTEQLEQQGFNVKYEEMPNVGLDWPDDTSGKIINWFESLIPAGK